MNGLTFVMSGLSSVRQSSEKLDLKRYDKLAQPNLGYHPVTYFSAVAPDLFDYILRKYQPSWGKNPGPLSRGATSPPAGAQVSEGN